MINSMTGFGKGAEKSPYGTVTAEIKTLNHKSLSINCAPFDGFFLMEEKIKKVFADKIYRGKVFIKISLENTGKQKDLRKVKVDEYMAGEYLKKIKKVQRALGVKGNVEIQDLINLPGVVECEQGNKKLKIWPYAEKALGKALVSLMAFRKREGARIEKDFRARLKKILKTLQTVKRHEKQSVAKYRDKITRTAKEIALKPEVDKGRLETEVAQFARNCDVAEEITRLAGHTAEFAGALRKVKTDVGKKLDFIAQEMQREANTIGSKSSDFRISTSVIDMKSEIEKMREQVKNVE